MSSWAARTEARVRGREEVLDDMARDGVWGNVET
jgi:hypothetical protein